MKFGIFYELQLPKPWGPGDEQQLVQDALAQVELADRLGLDYAWAVEHHFLEEYSHCSASDVFLAAAAARTKRIRLGHGIRQVIPNYNHPARTAEAVAMLDLVSNGRAELGIGEGATRLELGGFSIPAREKRALALEAAEQIANMMVMTPYPGFEGRSFKMPCRNVIPKPVQKPHPPMWMACTNRDTIKIAASLGLGALAFSFLDEAEARTWSAIYYDIIKSDACVPLGHSVNANIAMVSAFSLHADAAEAARRGQEGFEFFRYAIYALVTNDAVPGRSRLCDAVPAQRDERRDRGDVCRDRGPVRRVPGSRPASARQPNSASTCAPTRRRASTRSFCCSRLVATATRTSAPRSSCLRGDVLPEFKTQAAERERRKAEELAPYIERALARKRVMVPLADADIPVVRASVAKPVVNQGVG